MRNLVRQINTPSRVVVVAFLTVVAIGTGLLSMPMAVEVGQTTSWTSALFTATSAVCVTGLAVHDTAEHWSFFGEIVILVLMQIGGFGIMTLSSILAVVVSGRLGLRARLNTQAETKTLGPGDVRRVITGVAKVTLVVEVLTAAVLTVRFLLGYGEPFGRALYYGIFHSVSAFTNAGFALWPDSIMRFVGDPWICLPLALAVVAGGLGFPVYAVLRQNWRRPARWSLHAKITLGMTAVLLFGGAFAITITEWNNPGTMGGLSPGLRIMAGFFHSSMTRSGGLNSVDTSQMTENSWLISDVLMFIGAGSASTGGGIKVTTFALLGYVIIAELRGEPDVSAGRRRIPEQLQRQALTIALLSVATVALGTFVMMIVTPFKLDRVLFEVVSAFGTVGLSTGVTAQSGTAGHLVLTALMLIGRIGPVTLGAALALHIQTRRFRYPEERPSLVDKKNRGDAVVVIGLGRFGGSLAVELVGRDVEVLGVDSDSRTVQQLSGRLTHVVCADSTDPDALTQLGIAEFGRAVVGIGTDIEASILTTSILSDLGVPDIWAKAITLQHRRILERVGAHHVVQPEHDMGERVAHLVTGRMLDYVELDENYALIKTKAPRWADGKTLGELGIRKEYGVTVIGIKKPGSGFTYCTSDTVIQDGDTLLVAGETDKAERFAEET